MDKTQYASNATPELLSAIGTNIIELDLQRLEKHLDETTTKLECERFIRATQLWDDVCNEWHGLPKGPATTESIYGPLKTIIDNILAYFNHTTNDDLSSASGRRAPRGSAPSPCRKLHMTYSAYPKEMGDNDVRFYPDGVITGSENHFEQEMKDNWFERCVTFFDVMLDGEVAKEGANDRLLAQQAFYARECFASQLTCIFVWGLVFTERRLRVYRFDRAGVEVSDWINYHKTPRYLVQSILLTASYMAKRVGLDTTVIFNTKNQRAFTMKRKGKAVTLTEVKRRFRVSDIVGRGTVCWRVVDERGQNFLLKQQFVDPLSGSEPQLLEGLDIPGVVRMHAHQSFPRLSSFRKFKSSQAISEQAFTDRLMRRMLLEEHGSVLNKVSSRMDLLVAMKDAIIGHQNLWNEGILHRDISWDHVLYASNGASDAEANGPRGVLIDLHRAIRYRTASREELVASNSIGTTAFQSLNIRQCHQYKNRRTLPILRDHMDDLESFFWILHWITVVQPAPEVLDAHLEEYLSAGGDPKAYESPQNQDAWLDMWNVDVESSNAYALRTLGSRNEEDFVLQPGWGSTFRTLIHQLAMFFFERSRAIRVAFYRGHEMNIKDSEKSAPEDYKAVLALFEKAIEGLEHEMAWDSRSSLVREPVPKGLQKKRRREHDVESHDENGVLEADPKEATVQRRPKKRARTDNVLGGGNVWNQHPNTT
ncbi:hypothetical protein CVT24_013316 [Panaeolus cyanescens]|uniref:Fungal-type protein kinase domain-containing protein n=1 Tax=Panaeolus cyanescens TaxID=181874 RepID=A0A409WD55_9AGAR|nr:hypothetical protein CVT24_013316 [Panaeolus cyanescens]